MAYYPIKCPYCLSELSNYDVKFNLRTGTAIRTGNAQGGLPGGPGTGGQEQGERGDAYGAPAFDDFDDVPEYLRGGGGQERFGEGPAKGAGGARRKGGQKPTEGFFTYQEILWNFGEGNVQPILSSEIFAPPALANKAEYREDLLVGVEITVNEDGMETTTAYRRRYCRCEKELMAAAGMKASYVLLMLGPTSSGKTMFIIALHRTLRQEGGYVLPPKGTGAKGLAKLLVTVLSGGSSGDTSLKKMSDDLFDEGKLPLSTFALDNEPLVLDISVDFKTGKSSNALLFLRDLPGEYMANVDRTEMLDAIAMQFPQFDGFIMMLDPFTFEKRSVFVHDGNADTTGKEKMKFVENLDEVLTGKIGTYFGGRKIDRPTAVIVTKGDHFFNRDNAQRLSNEGVMRSFPTLTNWQKVSFDKPYFDEVDHDVKRVISALSPNIVKLLDKNFSNIFMGLSSALSKTPMEIEYRENGNLGPGNYITAPNAINPWRVADPFIRMLMMLKIVPPFNEVEIRKPDLERREALLARNSRYISMVNSWGRVYCNAWSEIAGLGLEDDEESAGGQPPRAQPPQKKGLFGKLLGR